MHYSTSNLSVTGGLPAHIRVLYYTERAKDILYMSKEYLIISIAHYEKLLLIAEILLCAVQPDNGDITC